MQSKGFIKTEHLTISDCHVILFLCQSADFEGSLCEGCVCVSLRKNDWNFFNYQPNYVLEQFFKK